MDSEDHLIERISKSVPSIRGCREPSGRGARRCVAVGIGHDAAVLWPGGPTDWILTCDSFIEGVHFLRQLDPPRSVGYKSLVRATSDLAAMGGAPRVFLLTLALPRACTEAWLGPFLAGMNRAALRLGVRLIGGDTTRASKVFISITVGGEIARGLAPTRCGARPGDLLYVSGRLGRAQLGLELLRRGMVDARRRDRALGALLKPHLYPPIRLALGAWLAKRRIASAMMDISDGLSTDLARLCQTSGVGATIDARRIPCVQIPEQVRSVGGRGGALRMALDGGEDYELLFTVPPRHRARLRGAPGFSQLTRIGEITRPGNIVLVGADGRSRPLVSGGWDPFRQRHG